MTWTAHWCTTWSSIGCRSSEYEAKNKGTITEIIPRFFGDHLTAEQIAALGEEKEALYRDMYAPHLRAIDGLHDFLESVKRRNIPMALATMGDQHNIRFTLNGLNISQYFDATVGGEEVTNGKPHPEVFQRAAAKLGVPPEDCAAFEDSHSGIAAALAAGMKTVGVASTHTPDELAVYPLWRIISDYREIWF